MSDYFKSIKSDFKLKHYANYIGVSLFFIIMIFMYFSGALRRSTQGLLTQIAFSIILAVSLNLIVGFLGELSLGHAGFMCVGAYLGCYLAGILNKSIDSQLVVLIITMIIGGLIAACFGLIIGLPALRLKGDYLAIVTLAFGEIVRTIFKNLDTFGGPRGLRTTTYDGALFIPSFVVILIMLFVIQNLMRSKHGRAITAIRDNEIAAKAMGINVTFYKLLAFTVAAFFAGVAGVIYGHFATPVLYSYFDYNYSIEILVMVVLGGMGSISGSIIAATLITFINFQLTTQLSGDMAALKFLIYALILIVMVIFNNAPALRPFKERFSVGNLRRQLRKKRSLVNPEKAAAEIDDDDAAWNRVPSKIKMDALLSTDLDPNGAFTPDKPGKEDK